MSKPQLINKMMYSNTICPHIVDNILSTKFLFIWENIHEINRKSNVKPKKQCL